MRKIIILLTVVLLGCNNDKPPKEWPDNKELALILSDIYVADATMKQANIRRIDGRSDAPNYYKDILEKHNLTKQEFDTIMNWYSDHPKLLMQVYDNTITILSSKEAKLNMELKIQDSIHKASKQLVLKDYWKGTRSFNIKSTLTSDKRIPFDIPINSISDGMVKLKANLQF